MRMVSSLFGALCILAGVACPPAWVARGDVLASFEFYASSLALDAQRHRILVTDYNGDSVTAIDTRTLNGVASASVGTNPTDLTLSPDGSRLYVANSGSQSITVLDAGSLTVIKSISIPHQPCHIAAGLGGRLYATQSAGDGIMQIDSNTDQYLGEFNLGVVIYRWGMLQISPDRRTLYFGSVGMSPGTLAKFDVSAPDPALLWTSYALGSNGQDLTLSHAGDSVYYVVGSTGHGYSIAKIRTSDMLILGSLNTGAYPDALALSPDDRIAYTIHQTGHIDLFDTTTYLKTDQISTSSSDYFNGADLMVDNTGSRLFVSYDNDLTHTPVLRVYDTGFPPIAEPVGLSSLATGLVCLAGCVLRRRLASEGSSQR